MRTRLSTSEARVKRRFPAFDPPTTIRDIRQGGRLRPPRACVEIQLELGAANGADLPRGAGPRVRAGRRSVSVKTEKATYTPGTSSWRRALASRLLGAGLARRSA